MRESSPMLQALTLSTNLTNTEKLRSKATTGNGIRDGDQSFTSRTMQHIKASHQPKSPGGMQPVRQLGAVQGRSPLTNPSNNAVRGRLRDAGSEARKLDVGLHVSAVKVSQRQPMEPGQASNGHSPYSTKAADSKGVTKRKGVVRSATFSAGSCEQTDTAHLRDNLLGHSVGRGFRPKTAPAASASHQSAPAHSTKQPVKCQQRAEVPELPFSLPGFRPSPCLTADSSLGRGRHGQRPGTPNPKADAATVSAGVNMPAHTRGNVRVPSLADVTLRSADAAKQDWLLARLASGKASIAHIAQHSRSAQLGNVDHQSADETCLIRSSSSIAASLEDAADKAQTFRGQHEGPGRSIVRAHATVPRQKSSHNLLDSASRGAVSSSDSIGFGGQGVSHGALSNALKSLGSLRQARESEGIQTPTQQHQTAVRHIGGNTVMSCVSASYGSVPETSESLGVEKMKSSPDPLVDECAQIMRLFGMDNVWFEGDFLPYAHSAVSLGSHCD